MNDADQSPEGGATEGPPEEERRLELPAWVPAAIGLTLVALAAMAVYTGFRTRVRPADRVESVAPFDVDGLYPEDSGGPPGSPEAGASRVRPGGEVPAPDRLEGGDAAGLSISGDENGVNGQIRLVVRRGLVLDVKPPDAIVYVNGVAVGTARQFSTAEDAYEFADEGRFVVRISAPGYEEAELLVSTSHEAAEEVARVPIRLQPAG